MQVILTEEEYKATQDVETRAQTIARGLAKEYLDRVAARFERKLRGLGWKPYDMGGNKRVAAWHETIAEIPLGTPDDKVQETS